MKKGLLLIAAILIGTFSQAQTPVEVGDITVPSNENFKGNSMVLNGAGIREKLWINLYVAALYLPQKSNDAQTIINVDKPMAIKLTIVSGLVSNDKMMGALKDGFEKSTHGNTEPIQDKIDSLVGFLQEDLKTGDVFDLVYIPSEGVIAYKNGEYKGTVPGLDFKQALFGIWLSDAPADDSLKEDLLGMD